MSLFTELPRVNSSRIRGEALGRDHLISASSTCEINADSNEGYSSKASCKHGIDLVKEQAANAEVEDQTESRAAQADRTEEEGLLEKAKRKLQ